MKRIWIDTDMALGAPSGMPNRDVDDGWAVAVLLKAAIKGEAEIVGISVCDGNTDAAKAFQCARALLRKVQLDNIPIIAPVGAAKSLTEVREGTLLLALGPLTNIANALALDAELADRTSLITVGGVHNGWNVRRRLSDLNIRRDPRAAAIAHAAFGDCRRMPLDVINRLTLDAVRMDRIEGSGTLGHYLASHSRHWLNSAKWRHGRSAFPVWDLVAALAALEEFSDTKIQPRLRAQYDAQNRLVDFDVDAAWHIAELLLAD